MIKNYIKIAVRSILRHKFYSLLNITGLSVGMAFMMFVGVYVWQELSVNRDLKNLDNQYILLSKWKDPNMGFEMVSIAELPVALKRLYPNLVKNYLRWDGVISTVSKGNKHFREGVQIVDSNMLQTYGFKLLYGDSKTALNDPFSVVISKDAANKYFGQSNVVGQAISIENFSSVRHDFIVTGVLDDIPKNSVTYINDDNKNEIFISNRAADFMGRSMSGWNNAGLVAYLELQDGVKPSDLTLPIRQLIKANAAEFVSDNLTVQVKPLSKYHLTANGGVVNKMLYTLSATALFILCMAAVNFINLCISRSSARMKEMGIRKVLGSMRKQLIMQFLVESTLLTLFAAVLSLGLYAVFNPYLSTALNADLLSLSEFPLVFFAMLVLVAFVIGIATGAYPAFVLSALKSVDSLKGKLAGVSENVLMRKGLVAFQFGTATVVFISALIVSEQIKLFFSKSLGYDKDFIVYIQTPRDMSLKGVQKMQVIKQQLLQLPQVRSATLSWEVPNGRNAGQLSIHRQGADEAGAVASQQLMTDDKFGETFGIPMKAGRFFATQFIDANVSEVVINQTNANALGWRDPEKAIGQSIQIVGSSRPSVVVGVIADFHFGSMQDRIPPVTFLDVNRTTYYRYLSFKLKPGDLEQSIAALQSKWVALLPGTPFDYTFMDTALEKLYKTEMRLKKASVIATSLATIIALLGVIGLVSQSIQKRAREIGIRKVLGSSVSAIISLFMHEFLIIICVAVAIACPLAYLLMQHWLNGYVYKIAITLTPFATSVGLLTCVTVVVVILLTIKAALSNPVESLRSE